MPSRRFTNVPLRRFSVGCVTRPGRLGDHQQVLVAVADGDRRALGLELGVVGDLDHERLSPGQAERFRAGFAVDRDAPGR